MKKLIILSLCSVLTLASGQTAEARTRKVSPRAAFDQCKNSVLVTSGGFIYKNSAPIRSGGVGTPLVGYRKQPTLILLRKGYSKSTTTIYSSTGEKIGRCPWASAHDAAGGRYRCTMNTARLRKAAITSAESATIFISVKANTCVEVPDAGRCYGSSKGLCNQLIK